MKLQLALIVTMGLAAGPAAAFSPGFEPGFKPSGFGSPSPQKKPAAPLYGVPAPPTYGSAPRRPSPGGYAPVTAPQDPPGARSYKPYTPGSVYAPPSRDAKPACDRSLYASACGKK